MFLYKRRDSCNSLPDIREPYDVRAGAANEILPRGGATRPSISRTESPNLLKRLQNRILLRQLSRSSPDVRSGIDLTLPMLPSKLQTDPEGLSITISDSGKSRSACFLSSEQDKDLSVGSLGSPGPCKADSAPEISSGITTFVPWNAGSTKVKLVNEVSARLCVLNHRGDFVGKILESKYLKRWEYHQLILTDASIASEKPSGFLETAILYSSIRGIHIFSSWDSYCLRIMIPQGPLLIQVNTATRRDQLYYSLLWKKTLFRYKQIASSPATRPEILLKETKILIEFTINLPIEDKEVEQTLFESATSLISKNFEVFHQETAEDLFLLLSPILSRNFPPEKLFLQFSRHIEKYPRSRLVQGLLAAVAERILKNAVDLSRVPYMNNFLLDYLLVLYTNGGQQELSNFLKNIRGPGSSCPHPGILSNLVAVCLSGTSSFYDTTSLGDSQLIPGTNIPDILISFIDSDTENEEDTKLMPCIFSIFQIITEFDDWRLKLSQLLQSVPFPQAALQDQYFMKNISQVIQAVGIDPRCEVHRRVLAIRSGRQSWFHLFTPTSETCPDDGDLWAALLETLLNCGCAGKQLIELLAASFMESLQLLGLRNNFSAQKALFLMLKMDTGLQSTDKNKIWLIKTTLEATESGREMYRELCLQQNQRTQTKQDGGGDWPSVLTFPAKATDRDVARLLNNKYMRNLKTLNLAFTKITNNSAEFIIQLSLLENLNLMSTQFGDDGLKLIFENLHELQVLNLCEIPITDEGLIHLPSCSKLRSLNLNSTRVSSAAVENLREKLPNLKEINVNYTDAW